MSQALDLGNPHRPIRVGVILMGGVTELADVAPVDLLYGLSKTFVKDIPEVLISRDLKAQAIDMEFHWVSEAGDAKPGVLTSNLSLKPTNSFETCPALDIVIMGAHQFGYTPNEAEVAFVNKCWNDCTAFIAICGGVMVPMQAGILDGKTATGPRSALEMCRQQAPTTNWVEKRWARDGKLWTSGALLNGFDLMYSFINEFWGGRDEAGLVAWLASGGSWSNRDVDYKDGCNGNSRLFASIYGNLRNAIPETGE